MANGIPQNAIKMPKIAKFGKKGPKTCLKMNKTTQNGLHGQPTFPCYTEAHLENRSGRARCAHNGPPGFLGGLR